MVKFRLEIVCIRNDGAEQRQDIMEVEREESVSMETLGMNLAEGKTLLEGAQDFITAQQVATDLARWRTCADCGERHTSKGDGTIEVTE